MEGRTQNRGRIGFVRSGLLSLGQTRGQTLCAERRERAVVPALCSVGNSAEETEVGSTQEQWKTSGKSPSTKASHWLGKKHREDSKKKISLANKGNTPWNKGRKHSEETRRKISERTRAAMLRPEMREKMRKVNVGRKHNLETKQKIKVKVQEKNAIKALRDGAKVKKGKLQLPILISRFTSGPCPFFYNPSLTAKLNNYINLKLGDAEFLKTLNVKYEGTTSARKGGDRKPRTLTPDARRKLSEKIREMWADPEYRERVVDGMRTKLQVHGRAPLSMQHRERIRESLLVYNAEKIGKSVRHTTDPERLKELEQRRILAAEKKEKRDLEREKLKQERKKRLEENRKREVLRSEMDKSLVEVLKTAGALPEPETPGIINLSSVDVGDRLRRIEFPEIHLNFDSDGDHVTTVKHEVTKMKGRKREDDLNIDDINDSELADDDDDDDDEDYSEDDYYDDEIDSYEEERLLRSLRPKKARNAPEQFVKKSVIVYVDGAAFEVDEKTGERVPALNTSKGP